MKINSGLNLKMNFLGLMTPSSYCPPAFALPPGSLRELSLYSHAFSTLSPFMPFPAFPLALGAPWISFQGPFPHLELFLYEGDGDCFCLLELPSSIPFWGNSPSFIQTVFLLRTIKDINHSTPESACDPNKSQPQSFPEMF